MPMPLWVMFPPLDLDARTLMIDELPDFLAGYGMVPYHAMPIAQEGDEIFYLDGEGRTTDDLSQMLAVGQGKPGVDLSFHVRSVRKYIRFAVLDQQMPATLCVEIPREILAHDSDLFGTSGWVVNFVSKLANKLACDCALSTRDEEMSGVLAPLDVREVFARLKSGRLFNSVTPVILALREDLFSAEELSAFVAPHEEAGFRLEQDGSYHVIWSLKGA
ncbi:hypothetical protein MASR1M32_15990 [Rhodobacter sp.]